MKKIILVSLCLFLWYNWIDANSCCFFSSGRFTVLTQSGDIYDEISAAIRSGNAKEIAKYFGNNVELTILTQEDVYSKVQAELIIKDFFVKNTPKTFTVIHRGTSKEGSLYAIGTLVTIQGVTLRTYFFIKQNAGKYYIQELRFDKE